MLPERPLSCSKNLISSIYFPVILGRLINVFTHRELNYIELEITACIHRDSSRRGVVLVKFVPAKNSKKAFLLASGALDCILCGCQLSEMDCADLAQKIWEASDRFA